MSDLAQAEARLMGAVTAVGLPRGRRSWSALFARRAGYLFSPIVDFLCLGGGSLIAMVLLWLLLPKAGALQGIVGLVALVVAHIINHPHFAHSYQIFYRISGASCSARNTRPDSVCAMRRRA